MKTEIISGSMEKGLMIGDKVIGNRLAYLFSDPERGDVIFFEYPKSDKMLYEIDPELTYRYDKSKKKKDAVDSRMWNRVRWPMRNPDWPQAPRLPLEKGK